MSNDDQSTRPLRIGDPVRLKDSDLDLRGAVCQLRSGQYVVVRWEDEWRSTHAATAIELDDSRSPPQRKLPQEEC